MKMVVFKNKISFISLLIITLASGFLNILYDYTVCKILSVALLLILLILFILHEKDVLNPESVEEKEDVDSLDIPEEEKMAYIGTVAAGLAHEIRNPLNAIDFNIRMIQEDLENGELLEQEDIKDRFNSTYREIKHLERLVSDFLLYARKTVLQLDKCNLQELLESVKNILFEQAIARKNIINLNIKTNLQLIKADREVLKQALFNIVKNGIEAMKDGGTLSIDTENLNINGSDMVEIRISDSGTGINPRDLKKIFHLFYTTRRGGTGLGLPVAKSIIENHKGWIEVESRPAEGTTFKILIPAWKE